MSRSAYHNAAQQRIIQVILCLFGHEIRGVAASDLASMVGTTASNMTRDLSNLCEAGIAEQLVDSNRWRLTTRLPKAAATMLRNIERERALIEETARNYTRQA